MCYEWDWDLVVGSGRLISVSVLMVTVDSDGVVSSMFVAVMPVDSVSSFVFFMPVYTYVYCCEWRNVREVGR